jgi:hypothetical protein
MRVWPKRAEELFWSIDALLFVLAYTTCLLLIPTPSPQWRARRRASASGEESSRRSRP